MAQPRQECAETIMFEAEALILQIPRGRGLCQRLMIGRNSPAIISDQISSSVLSSLTCPSSTSLQSGK